MNAVHEKFNSDLRRRIAQNFFYLRAYQVEFNIGDIKDKIEVITYLEKIQQLSCIIPVQYFSGPPPDIARDLFPYLKRFIIKFLQLASTLKITFN